MGLTILGIFNMLMFTMLSGLALASHGKAMLTNPGAVPDQAVPSILATIPREDRIKYDENQFRTCRRCRTFKPSRAHHCRYIYIYCYFQGSCLP